uniref:Uncharacterized protein n=1 Tax=Timema tahoe TaxID=61484 RepID=A0A7R9NW68_9NEOP|nr:unnamed protein product [Timema tahoe]
MGKEMREGKESGVEGQGHKGLRSKGGGRENRTSIRRLVRAVLPKQVIWGLKRTLTRKCTRICVEEEYKIILKKTTLSTPGQDSNLNLPIIIISLVYCESSALDHAATEAGKSRVGRRPHWIYWNRYSRNNSSAKSTEIRFPDGSRVPPLPLGKTNKRLVVSLSYRPTPTILTDCEYPSLHLVTEPFLHIHSESDASCIHSSKHENTPLRSIPVRRYSTCHNRHGTGGSASSPKEVLLRMFIAQEKSVDPDWVQTQWREPLYEPTY